MLKRNNKGFTLPELIVVIAIVAILATVISLAYTSFTEKSRQKMDAELMKNIAHEAEIYGLEAELDDAELHIQVDPGTGEIVHNQWLNSGYSEVNKKIYTAVQAVAQFEGEKVQSKLYRSASNPGGEGDVWFCFKWDSATEKVTWGGQTSPGSNTEPNMNKTPNSNKMTE